MNTVKSSNIWNVYSISGILWDDGDISLNMKKYLEVTDLLFVEDIPIFNNFIARNQINFSWKMIQITRDYNIKDYEKIILSSLIKWENVSLFESSWTACLVDPWVDLINFIYKIREKIPVNLIPIPWTGATPTAISVCGFMMDNYIFINWISENTHNEILKYDFPLVYFNHYRKFDEFINVLNFMQNDDLNRCFVWVNLWKIWVKNSNLLIRWTYKHVYNELNKIFKDQTLPDLILIFEKKWY